jgi:hypothetical protein
LVLIGRDHAPRRKLVPFGKERPEAASGNPSWFALAELGATHEPREERTALRRQGRVKGGDEMNIRKKLVLAGAVVLPLGGIGVLGGLGAVGVAGVRLPH